MSTNFFELDGKIALVTGASSGLGKHFATVLANAGCTVIATARRQNLLDDTVSEIKTAGGNAHAVRMDLSDVNELQTALNQCFSEIGVPDILINNAGIATTSKFLDVTEDDALSTFNVNQLGVWRVSQHVCNKMIESQKSGAVINIASVLGLDVMRGVSSYAVSKAAVVQLTKVMALELARHNIRVNAIAPGYFSTDMNKDFLNSDAGKKLINRVPTRRAGNMEDLDGLLLLLASDKSAYMTGSVIPVDGGHLVAGLA